MSFQQDFKYALRGLRRSPVFTATVVVTLALGVGANGAIYSYVDRVFLRLPAGIPDAHELRTLNVIVPSTAGSGRASSGFTHDDFVAIQSGTATVARVAGYSYSYFGTDDPLTRVRAVHATAEFLPIVTARPALGRFFTADEERRMDNVAVVSHEFWERRLGADSAALGHTIEVDKQRYVVIGIAADRFTGIALNGADVWLPIGTDATMALVARLNTGNDERQLDAAATVAYRRLRYHANDADSMRAVLSAPPIPGRAPGSVSTGDAIALRIAGVAIIILLITITNVATLLFLRAARREREIAIRLAMGASRARLFTQLLTEGTLLAAIGGTAAIFVGAWGGSMLRVMISPQIRWDGRVADSRLVAFTIFAALATGVLASLAPAIRATSPQLSQSLRGGAREGAFQRSQFSTSLVATQTALSLLLIVGAGLFVRSLRNVHAIELGYDIDRLVAATVTLDRSEEVPADFQFVLTDEVARLKKTPSVERVGFSGMRPMGGLFFSLVFRPSGDTVGSNMARPSWNAVSPDFFATVGMRLRSGRDFNSSDIASAPRVMIVNESMAKVAWPGEPAIGQCLMLGATNAPCTTVIGIVSDAHLSDLMEAEPGHYYVPIAQALAGPKPMLGAQSAHYATITMRVPPNQRASLTQLVRSDLRARLPGSAAIQIDALKDYLAPRYQQWREGAVLFSALGALALLITSVGVYGVVSYMVARRTHEMGVRIALGAQHFDIVRLVLREGLNVVSGGLMFGAALALAVGQLIASQLYDVSPRDPAVLISASLLLAVVAVVASVAPAWRAMHVDPIEELRTE